MSKFDEYLNSILAAFDSLNWDDGYKRRICVKPLYDYFQILVLEVAVHLCGLNRNSLRNCHLKARWNIIKSALHLVDKPEPWDQLISSVHNMRSSVEHNDYSVPAKEALIDAKKRAPEFKEWLVAAGKKYLEESKGFSFAQEYLGLARLYVGQADRLIDQYGERPPFSLKTDVALEEGEQRYRELKSLKDRLNSRILEIHDMNDLKKEDLENLVQLVKETERLDAMENVFLQFSICPKCGGKIVETQTDVGGSPDDPMPTAIVYRVGCEKCDYVFNQETIDI